MSELNHQEFQIFTTLRYDRSCYFMESLPDSNERCFFFYLPLYHQRRLLESCKYFGWSSALAKVKDYSDFVSDIEKFIYTKITEGYDLSPPLRVKVILSNDGNIILEAQPTATVHTRNLYPTSLSDLLSITLNADSDTLMHVLHVSRQKIHPFPHTRVKTTFRSHYCLAQIEVGIQHDLNRNEVLLTNTSNEVMEGSYSSVYFLRHGHWVTPPLDSGGQDGTTRKWALDQGHCLEGTIMFESLVDGEHCCISNGLRGFQIAVLKLF